MPALPEHRMTTVDKAALLLARIGAGTEPVGVSDLARATGIPKSTVHRLLAILERNGVIERSGARYAVGGAHDWSAVHARRLHRLATIARPFLVDLYARSGFIARLAVRTGSRTRFLDSVYPATWIDAMLTSNAIVDPHWTASGKILLAYDAVYARAHLAGPPLIAATPHTIVDPVRLTIELSNVRRRGFAVEHQEHLAGVAAVAVPLIASGAAFGSISLAGPISRLHPERVAAPLGRAAGDIATAIRRHGMAA